MFELCIRNSLGETVIDTTINFESELNLFSAMESSREYLFNNTLRKVYGLSSTQNLPGMTFDEVADTLERYGFGAKTLMIEWSVSRCEYDLIRSSLASVGREKILPPRTSVVALPMYWRQAFPHVEMPLSLSALYRVVFPDSNLWKKAHCAAPDVQMLQDLAATLFKSSLQRSPLRTIGSYMQAQEWILLTGAHQLHHTSRATVSSLLARQVDLHAVCSQPIYASVRRKSTYSACKDGCSGNHHGLNIDPEPPAVHIRSVLRGYSSWYNLSVDFGVEIGLGVDWWGMDWIGCPRLRGPGRWDRWLEDR